MATIKEESSVKVKYEYPDDSKCGYNTNACRSSRRRHRCRCREYHRTNKDRSRSCRGSRRKSIDKTDTKRDQDVNNEIDKNIKKGPNTGCSGVDIKGYGNTPPNSTIMITGLALHITENAIRQEFKASGIIPKNIRVIRKKDTGMSRGFAFVEFSTVSEAVQWMEINQGILKIQNQYQGSMQYSRPKNARQKPENSFLKCPTDWFCIKCGFQNFRKRLTCYQCNASRIESEEGGSGRDEICTYTTKTVMLRNLDVLTTEENVIQALQISIPELVSLISAIFIGHDHVTAISRGICYLGTERSSDALTIHTALKNLQHPLKIDGKPILISYCKYYMGDSKSSYNDKLGDNFKVNDVDNMAACTAGLYAKCLKDYYQYYEYYKNYFEQHLGQVDSGNTAAAIAQSAMEQLKAKKGCCKDTYVSVPNGTDGKHYPIPNIQKYTPMENSDYHYDSSTGLHYDPSSTYYWNSNTQKFLYYDYENLTFKISPFNVDNYVSNVYETLDKDTKRTKVDKRDKTTMSKKIAKDMQRWAKTLNKKKERNEQTDSVTLLNHHTASADIGYTILEKRSNEIGRKIQKSEETTSLVPEYLIDSDTSDEEPSDKFLDYSKLICNLCKRQFSCVEALNKHQKLSLLHKKNLETLDNQEKPRFYRDRAKERRTKFGYTEEIQSEAVNLTASVDRIISSESISADNFGNKILHKMGWVEGQGLGKSNQGRTSIIQIEQRRSVAGLGSSFSQNPEWSGQNYGDFVRKMTRNRYQETMEGNN